MGLFSKAPGDLLNSDLTLQLNFSGAKEETIEMRKRFLPSEWFPQSGIQLTWPHEDTDWNYILEEVNECFIRLAYEISSRQSLLIVTPQSEKVNKLLQERLPKRAMENICFFTCDSNDTWARDHAFITIVGEEGNELLDFSFNGWGNKFESNLDNNINKKLADSGLLRGSYIDCLHFVLEGGSIESDGRGTLLTTSDCLLTPTRNPKLNKTDIEGHLKRFFSVDRVLWLDYGALKGDDTDSHIDTLARFCPNDTIVYVQCKDKTDEHYQELLDMENQLKEFRTISGEPYTLLPLPMPEAIYANIDNGHIIEDPNKAANNPDVERLPATYANFLILNEAILYPTYNQPENDEKARKVLQKAFPKHAVIGIDCRVLIKQHGSLHCVTMQYPAGTFTHK